MKKIIFLSVLIIAYTGTFAPKAAASFKSLCLKSSGEIIARSGKCLNGEQVTSLSNLMQSGPKGATGVSGASTVIGREVLFSSVSESIPGNSTFIKNELCPVGKVSLGGGCIISSSGFVFVAASFPFDSTPQQAWSCHFRNYVGVPALQTLTSLVICANPS